jgi:organizing structure protein 2
MQSQLNTLRRQLSIYDPPERETVLVDTPSKLEQNIGVARRMVTGTYRDAYAQVQGVVSKWIGVERAVESTSLLLAPFVLTYNIP